MLYTYKIVLDLREEFSEFLINLVQKLVNEKKISDENAVKKCNDILNFQNSKILKISEENNIAQEHSVEFTYDILKWIKNDYKKLEKANNKICYSFFVPNHQKKAIMRQITENKSKSINSKFRDMSVYTSTKQFFYSVKRV